MPRGRKKKLGGRREKSERKRRKRACKLGIRERATCSTDREESKQAQTRQSVKTEKQTDRQTNKTNKTNRYMASTDPSPCYTPTAAF